MSEISAVPVSWGKLGGRAQRCAACGETFASDSAGDKHRRGDWTPDNPRRCLTSDEMRDKGMLINDHGRWVSEANPTCYRSV